MSFWEKIKAFFGWKKEESVVAIPPVPSVAPAPAPAPVITTPSNPAARVRGLDVSKWQDKMDASEWKEAWDKGFKFVYAKCTDGASGKDGFYQLHRRLAKQQGFLFGGYHYFRFGYDPIVQAEHFFKTCGHMIGELPPVLDVEWDKYSANGKYGEGKRMDEQAVQMVRACVRSIKERFGVDPIIYTNAYFWPEKIANPETFNQLLCWIPSYADKFKPSGDEVRVPYPWKQWNIWQDSESYKLGDVTAIDTNVFRGSLDDLKKLVRQ